MVKEERGNFTIYTKRFPCGINFWPSILSEDVLLHERAVEKDGVVIIINFSLNWSFLQLVLCFWIGGKVTYTNFERARDIEHWSQQAIGVLSKRQTPWARQKRWVIPRRESKLVFSREVFERETLRDRGGYHGLLLAENPSRSCFLRRCKTTLQLIKFINSTRQGNIKGKLKWKLREYLLGIPPVLSRREYPHCSPDLISSYFLAWRKVILDSCWYKHSAVSKKQQLR